MEQEIWESSIDSWGFGKAPATEQWNKTWGSWEQDGMYSFWGLTAAIAGLDGGVIFKAHDTRKYQQSTNIHISLNGNNSSVFVYSLSLPCIYLKYSNRWELSPLQFYRTDKLRPPGTCPLPQSSAFSLCSPPEKITVTCFEYIMPALFFFLTTVVL